LLASILSFFFLATAMARSIRGCATVDAKTIRGAKTARGCSDREHLYKAVGFLPTPKGSQILLNLNRAIEEKDVNENGNGTGDLPLMALA